MKSCIINIKMTPPMERIQVLDSIEKDIVTCLHSAGIFVRLRSPLSLIRRQTIIRDRTNGDVNKFVLSIYNEISFYYKVPFQETPALINLRKMKTNIMI